MCLNPITYGIFEISQAKREEGFWPGSRKQGYSYRIDLKFATNNGKNDTSKHAKFNVIGYSIL